MGAYTKQTWDTTSIFNPTRMNHIEQGIYDASTDRATDTSVTGLKIQREGKIVCIFFNWISISVGADGKTLNKVIPNGLRPTNTFIVCCKAYGSSGYVDAKLTINTDGTMSLNALDSSAISGLNIIYTQISHVTYFIA